LNPWNKNIHLYMTKIALAGFAFILIASSGFTQTIQPKIVIGNEKGFKQSKIRDATIAYNEGVHELNNHQYQEGVESFRKALELDSHYVEAWDELGLCYQRLNDYTNAAACYERSISIYPNGYVAHLDLAMLYGYLNRLEDQKREYNLVKEIDPENPESFYGLAIVSADDGNYKDAIENAQLALERYKKRNDGNCVDAEKLLSLIYSKQGDVEKERYWNNEALADKSKNH